MGSLLIEHIAQLVTCDGNDQILQDVDLYAENGVIRAIGPNLGKTADVVLSGRHMLCYPGLVNTTSISSFRGTCRRCRIWSCSTG